MIIDGTDLILGRVASFAAKKALLGEKVNVINCEKIAITGNKKNIFKKYKDIDDKGDPYKGPFLPKMPDRFVRKVIKRMLKYKNPRGKKAFQRIMCYIGVPDKFKEKKSEEIKKAHIKKLPNFKYITIKELCKHLGGKVE